MKNFYVLLILLIACTGYSQHTVLQDFEGSPVTAQFGGSTFSIVPDPEVGGTRGNVGKAVAVSSGTIWQGVEFSLSQNVQLTTDKTMQIDVYSLSPITIAPKIQQGLSGAPQSVTSASHTGSGWETLLITFNQSLDGKVPANGEYAQFVFHCLWDNGTNTFINPAIDRTFYFDNIKGIGISPPVLSDAPSTNYTYPAENVLSFFSDYTDVPQTRESFSVATESVETIAGNEVLKFVNTQFYAVAGTFDLSNVERLELDYWFASDTHNGGAVKLFIKIEDMVNNQVYLFDLAPPGITSGSWQSVSLDFSTITFPATMDLSNIGRVFIDNTNEGGSFYIDNFIFSADQSLSRTTNSIHSVKIYPNPATDFVNISARESIDSIEVFDLLGKSVLKAAPKNSDFNLNIAHLRKGVYLLKMQAGDKQSTAKLIK